MGSNVKQLMSYIGKTGNVTISGQDGIRFGVTVTDARMVYSNVQVYCEPISGTGGRWYALSSVEFSQDSNNTRGTK